VKGRAWLAVGALPPLVTGLWWMARAHTQPGRGVRGISLPASPSVTPGGRGPTPEGATTAADDIAEVMGSEAMLDPGRRRAVLYPVIAPEARPAMEAGYDAAMAQLEGKTGWGADLAAGIPVLMRSAVFGSRVVAYDGATAKVEVWMASVVGTARSGPVAEAWGTTAMELRWAQGRWWLASVFTTDGPGPTEALTPPAPPADLYAWAATGPRRDAAAPRP